LVAPPHPQTPEAGLLNKRSSLALTFGVTKFKTMIEINLATLAKAMEQHALKNVNNCWNTNISLYLETSGGQNSNLYLNLVHFFNTSLN
jgi:hypothetical protein